MSAESQYGIAAGIGVGIMLGFLLLRVPSAPFIPIALAYLPALTLFSFFVQRGLSRDTQTFQAFAAGGQVRHRDWVKNQSAGWLAWRLLAFAEVAFLVLHVIVVVAVPILFLLMVTGKH